MRDAEKTVGNMIDKEKTIFVGSVDAEGLPNIKAMLQTRKREGIKHIYLQAKWQECQSVDRPRLHPNHAAGMRFGFDRTVVKLRPELLSLRCDDMDKMVSPYTHLDNQWVRHCDSLTACLQGFHAGLGFATRLNGLSSG